MDLHDWFDEDGLLAQVIPGYEYRAGQVDLAQAMVDALEAAEPLLAEAGTGMRSVELDVLDESNSEIYWERSDRFDTVVDFRFEQPALDAFARIMEAWLLHLLRLEVRIEPRPKLEDPDWRWHIGLDRESNRILNALFEGRQVSMAEAEQFIALFRMWIKDERLVIDRVKRRPVYLALAMTPAKRVKMKPQNLLFNLPLLSAA